MIETHFSIHGAGVRLSGDGRAAWKTADRLLSYFRSDAATQPPPLELHVNDGTALQAFPFEIPASAQVIFSKMMQTQLTGTDVDFDIAREGAVVYVNLKRNGRLRVDGPARRAEAWFADAPNLHPEIIASFVLFALVELLKQHNLYMIHAAALEKNGRGVLIVGAGGRGKTTSCLSLLRDTYRYLSDDHPFLRETPQGLELLCFPEKIDVTDQTIAFFPELREGRTPIHQGFRKKHFFLQDLYPEKIATSAPPVCILFPSVIDNPDSFLEPMPKSRALEKLLPQGLMVVSGDVARRQFQVLTRLAQQADCYKLHFGSNILELPRVIDRLVQ